MYSPENSGKQTSRTKSKSNFVWLEKSMIADGKQHYKSCVIRGTRVQLNDFVTINTGDSLSVGRVLDLHDLGPYPDPNRAKIHWLYKYEDLTQLISDCTLENRPNELFIPAFDPERKPSKRSVQVIDAESIENVCSVKFLEQGQRFPRNCSNEKDTFYVMYAFDENFQVYSAVDYIKELDIALSNDSKSESEKHACRTPRRLASSRDIQWRIGTPKEDNHNNSPFSLKPLKITLKAYKTQKSKKKTPSKTRESKSTTGDQHISSETNEFTKTLSNRNVSGRNSKESDNGDQRKIMTKRASGANSEKMRDKKLAKRKASKSIPDVELEPKRTRTKSKNENKSISSKKETTKKLLTPCNSSFTADEAREIILSDDCDNDDEQSGYGSGQDVFFTDKTPEKKTPSKRKLRSQSKALKNLPSENQNHVSKQPPNPPYQTLARTSQSTSFTKKTRVQSIKSTKKVATKDTSRKQTTKVVGDVLAGGLTPKKTPQRVGRSVKKSLAQGMTPSIPCRKQPCKTPRTPLQEARSRLHVSAIPPSLPCREDEFADILGFVEGKLIDGTGGCMYISGVPGTGKTATVHEVIRVLQESQDENLSAFKFIEINGMKLTEPNQAYSMLLKKLTGQNATPAHASDLLEKMFTGKNATKESLVLMVDELDLLWTRKQGVMYNLFEWPSRTHSQLIVLTIANTMDLPERMMINRVQSRLGLTRLTFQPYTYSQLQEIVLSRIKSLNVFDPDAMQLVARKVAAVSGDARRCLDICRRAVEITEQQDSNAKSKNKRLVGMAEVNLALQDMFSSPKIKLMTNLSSYEMVMMKAVLSEFKRTGVEETTFGDVFEEFCTHCRLEGVQTLSMTETSSILGRLGASRLLLVETGRLDLQRRISLNVNQDDVIYALRNHAL